MTEALKEELEAIIRQEITSSQLSVTYLCERLKVSRSTLFRLLERNGGVVSYIRAMRLEGVRQDLKRSRECIKMADLSRKWQLGNASNLSRAFSLHFGMSPTAFWTAHWRSTAERGQGQKQNLVDDVSNRNAESRLALNPNARRNCSELNAAAIKCVKALRSLIDLVDIDNHERACNLIVELQQLLESEPIK